MIFQKKNRKPFKCNLFDDINSDFNFWIKQIDDTQTRVIKYKLSETQNEIDLMYPSLVSKSANICFDNFMYVIFKNKEYINEENIVQYLAIFKINSWQMADELGKGKMFFGNNE